MVKLVIATEGCTYIIFLVERLLFLFQLDGDSLLLLKLVAFAFGHKCCMQGSDAINLLISLFRHLDRWKKPSYGLSFPSFRGSPCAFSRVSEGVVDVSEDTLLFDESLGAVVKLK